MQVSSIVELATIFLIKMYSVNMYEQLSMIEYLKRPVLKYFFLRMDDFKLIIGRLDQVTQFNNSKGELVKFYHENKFPQKNHQGIWLYNIKSKMECKSLLADFISNLYL